MIKQNICQLNNRSLIKVSGTDSKSFLQGLISNDISLVNSNNMIFSGMFNPQGKFFCDFFIFQPYNSDDQIFYIDSNLTQTQDIISKFNTYKLRAKIKIEDISNDYSFYSIIDGNQIISLFENEKNNLFTNCFIHQDPRLNELGKKIYVPINLNEKFLDYFSNYLCKDLYEMTRVQLGIPEGVNDIIPNKDFPLDFGYDQLNAISFSKGCYIGQEITARTHNRGKLKRKIFLVRANKNLPDINAKIYYKYSKVGKMLSKFDSFGMALLDKNLTDECINNNGFLESNETKIIPSTPSWYK